MKSHNAEDAVFEVIDLLCGNINGNDEDSNTFMMAADAIEQDDDRLHGKRIMILTMKIKINE
jgi:hypothetical protein